MTTLDTQLPEQNINLFNETPINLNDTLNSQLPHDTTLQPTETNITTMEEGEYEVEALLEKRKVKNRVFYLVKWKNFSLDYATWEPMDNLRNALAKVREFEKLARLRQNLTDGEHESKKNVKKLKKNGKKAVEARKHLQMMKKQKKNGRDDMIVQKIEEGEETYYDESVTVRDYDFRDKVENKKGVLTRSSYALEDEDTQNKGFKKVKLDANSERKPKGAGKLSNLFQALSSENYQPLIKMAYNQLPRDKNLMSLTQKDDVKFPLPVGSINNSLFDAIKTEETTHEVTVESSYLSDFNNHDKLSNFDFPRKDNILTNKDKIQLVCLENNKFKIFKPKARKPFPGMPFPKIDGKESLQIPFEVSKFMEYKALPSTSNKSQASEDSDQSIAAEDSSDSGESDYSCVDAGNLSTYGSLAGGDIPLKVIGVRPVAEMNDLEVMMAWKVRPNGIQPENSRIMRVELLRNNCIMPLIEYYESKMSRESLPAFTGDVTP